MIIKNKDVANKYINYILAQPLRNQLRLFKVL